MRERKVFGLLATLGREEMDMFHSFLGSPLFEQTEVLQRFLVCLQIHVLPAAEEAELPGVEEILEGSGLVASRFDKYCSALHKRLLEYMAWREYMQNDLHKLQLGMEAMSRRSAPRKEYEALRARLAGHIEGLPLGAERLRMQMDFLWQEAEDRVQGRETQQVWQEDFQQLQLATDRYYLLQKLKLECAAANARLIFNQPSEPERSAQLIDLPQMDAEEAASKLDPLSLSYWITLQLYASSDGNEEFLRLFAHLQQHSASFEEKEQRDVYNYVLNYCLRRSNRGEVQFQRHAATLYRELLGNGVILQQGKLAPQMMKNIVVIHCLVDKLDWVQGFLEEYKDRLEGGEDPNIIKYNLAVLAFYREERVAIELFREVISQLKDDIFYELDSRTYLLKAYYEHLSDLSAEELDEMYKIFDSFRIFLDRNKVISSQHKQRYRNFLLELRRFLKIMEAAPGQIDQVRLKKFEQKIRSTELLANKGWLLEKVAQQIVPG